jgi:hypothetical protein
MSGNLLTKDKMGEHRRAVRCGFMPYGDRPIPQRAVIVDRLLCDGVLAINQPKAPFIAWISALY